MTAILFGYHLSEVHQFTYDWETWEKGMKKKQEQKPKSK
jgi:hypothetical protein